MGTISLSRLYDDEAATGRSFLVDRLWPRGISRDRLSHAQWCKDVAPSTDLRKWFGHDPHLWEEFQQRYAAELDENPLSWQPLADAAMAGDITLLYSSKDREHNNAVALRDYLMVEMARQ